MFTASIPLQVLIAIPVLIVIIFISDLSQVGTSAFQKLIQRVEILIVLNTAWQIGALALGTLLVARLHTIYKGSGSGVRRFIRAQSYGNKWTTLGSAVLLVIAIQPVVWFLGWLNSLMPVPQTLEQIQLDQMEFIKNLMQGNYPLIFILFNIAVVPAICEEIMFRGYIMRTFEKHFSAVTAIAASSILFGLFHLQPTNLIPLATIGGALAILTYYTNSLYPAMAAHFVNNGSAVLFNKYFPDSKLAATTIDAPPPVWMVALSVVFSALIIKLLVNSYRKSQI